MIDIIMVYIMYFFLSSPHDFGIFTFGSFLGHHIPALEFLKILAFSVLVSYKRVSYKKKSVSCMAQRSPYEGLITIKSDSYKKVF